MLKQHLYLCFLCLISVPNRAWGQDVLFSQFYANPSYLNPALVGTTPQGRIVFNFRSQFPALAGEFVSYNLNFDQHLPKSQSSWGIGIHTDKAGIAGLRSTNLNIAYAYTIPLSSAWAMRSGMQAGYGNRSLNYFQLVFGDQLSPTGVVQNSSPDLTTAGLNVHYLSLATGIALYKDNFWISIAAHHLNSPNQSLTGQTPEPLAPRYSMQVGYKSTSYAMGARRKEGYTNAWHPIVAYSQQGQRQQLDAGAYFYAQPMTFGAFLRGIPLKPQLNTALNLLIGFKYKGLNFLYSYDLPVAGVARNLGGTHEISLIIQAEDQQTTRKKVKKRKKKKINIVNFPSLID